MCVGDANVVSLEVVGGFWVCFGGFRGGCSVYRVKDTVGSRLVIEKSAGILLSGFNAYKIDVDNVR